MKNKRQTKVFVHKLGMIDIELWLLCGKLNVLSFDKSNEDYISNVDSDIACLPLIEDFLKEQSLIWYGTHKKRGTISSLSLLNV